MEYIPLDSASPVLRMQRRRPAAVSYASSIAMLLLSVMAVLVVMKGGRRDRMDDLVESSASLSSAASSDWIFNQSTAPADVRGKIESGWMVCCKRKGSDIPPPAYLGYYNDFPMVPVCIPGYNLLDTSNGPTCTACEEGKFCPEKKDLVFTCPAPLTSRRASGSIEDCWCPAGMYGVDATHENNGNCHSCPVDHFCPGRFDTVPCHSDDIVKCLQYPYNEDKWPAMKHECPPGSDTGGLVGQSTCVCQAGYYQNPAMKELDCLECEAGYYCPAKSTPQKCGVHEMSQAGSATRAQCLCVEGYEKDGGECKTVCKAQPGEYCEKIEASDSLNPLFRLLPCPQGYFCLGGRGGTKAPCQAAPGSYCPQGATTATGVSCPVGHACAGLQADKVECAVAQGYSCPPGQVSSPTQGVECPEGYFCVGGSKAKQPCTVAAGHYCPKKGFDPAGEICPIGCAPALQLIHFCAGESAVKVDCTALPGQPWLVCSAPVLTVNPSGFYCPEGWAPERNADPLAGKVCDGGSFCTGGTTGPQACQAAVGFFCPAGSSTAVGKECPVGHFCIGGTRLAQECTAAPGSWCPPKSSDPAGQLCPAGSACKGGSSDKIPCVAGAGSYCPEGSQSSYGVPCPQGLAAPGSAECSERSF
eukprot:764793-Hanusia_phi.AAC.1